jgi:hypothetical protein
MIRAKSRRFAKLDVAQLNEDWIIAVRSWLAHKDRTNGNLEQYSLSAIPALAERAVAALVPS